MVQSASPNAQEQPVNTAAPISTSSDSAQTRFRDSLESLLKPADIQIDGARPWDIQVRNPLFFQRVMAEGSLGLGESYMDGWWDCAALDQFVYRALQADLHLRIERRIAALAESILARIVNFQSPTRSRQVIQKHYDLDAAFFMSFLDPYNQYTCGYFKDSADLNKAQELKLDLICRKLNLSASDRVLDIGCGWGGFSKFAASKYGCHVTGISISDEQIRYAREFCSGLPVEILKCDYRKLKGSFDKVLVCGMLEHVGAKNYRRFMKIVHSVLKPDGIFLLHTIGGNKPQRRPDAWLHKYIFPNYLIPSIPELGSAFRGLFCVEDWHNFGPYYDPTLMAWNENFERAWPQLAPKFDERFRRMWNYYFLCCAGYFRARRSQLWHVVMTKVGRSQPQVRYS
ncbi:MAG: cyclopropane fatty acyl phospholipid synthase [Deltaproteobacteria bacterium]|nr:cyclopropane fatty acyl phospholipid synthase [Deltaproteobacteria bacterium]